ncbi:MAG: hypothetical protein C0467_19960 [Planctomycetaceae bacterium]|nr:hypothetical protein [Planctomycetaceae bacterium]
MTVARVGLLHHKGSAPEKHSDSEPVVKPKSDRVTPELADRNAAQIVALWEWGCDCLENCPPARLVYRKATKRLGNELARLKRRQSEEKASLALGLNLDTLGKLRRIAADYDRKKIETMANKIRRHRSRFSTSHLIRSLAVADRKTRDSLLAQAIRESWTLSTLERHVQVARGARRVGAGRKPFVPPDKEQCLVVLEGLCLRWLRWTEDAATELPSGVRNLVRDADIAVAAVQTGLAKHLPRGKKGEGRRRKR